MLNSILSNKLIKRVTYILIFLSIWQFIFELHLFSSILLPAPSSVFIALYNEIVDGSMFLKISYTLYLICIGLLLSFIIVAVCVIFANKSALIKDLLKTLISVLDPIPGIALLPFAILWFGIGQMAIIAIMLHSIIWPTLLNILIGFDSVPKIYKEVGENIGLSKTQMIKDIYIPAAFPSILIGIKNGWARAWRSLIAAEMVFGATGTISGLGWDIYIKRSYLDMPGMLATLLILMLIGILVEDILFSTIENKTIKKWGMV